MADCQKCGGEIQGWVCQDCKQAFRETDDGKLIFDHYAADAPMEAVAWREKVARIIKKEVTERIIGCSYPEALAIADAALAVIPTEGLGSSSPKSEDTHRAADGAVLASLVAAVSILEEAHSRKLPPNKVVGSDKMFCQMLTDYNRAIAKGRQAYRAERANDRP